MTSPIILLEKDPDQAVGSVSPGDVLQWLDHCDWTIDRNPEQGLRFARTAVRATLRLRMRCLHARSIGTVATAYRFLERFERADRWFGAAFRIASGCECPFCWSGLNRKMALLRQSQKLFSEALDLTDLSLRACASDSETAKTLFVRGSTLGHSGNVDLAIRDHRRALNLVSPDSKLHNVALRHFGKSLSLSWHPNHLADAAELLPKIRASYRGLKRAPLLRAIEHWLEGSVYARQAEVKPGLTGHQRYGLRCQSAHHIRLAVNKFRRLPVPLDRNACASDLAAVEYHISRERLEAALNVEPAPELADLWKAVRRALQEPEPVFWAALEALRATTVERGCTPPLVPYGAETGW